MTATMLVRTEIIDGVGSNSHFLAEVARSQIEPTGVRFIIVFVMKDGTSEHCEIYLTIISAEPSSQSGCSFQIEGFANHRPIRGIYDTHTRRGYFEYV